VSTAPDTANGVHVLAGLVAREVDKLLTIILGYTELAIQDLDVRNDLLDDLRVVRGSTERARRLTDGLHTLSLRRAVHPVVLDLGDWLPARSSALDHLAGTAVRVETLGRTTAHVRIDPEQLDLMLAQLVLNGAESYDGAGVVTISIRARPTAKGSDCVAIRVKDQGRGMDPATLRRSTEPLFTTRPSDDASGLGLSIVKIATTQAGGELHLWSRRGRGTTATVLLPAASANGDQGSKR
jgi:two-component system cell cycle sensor histidine kinase/response regulator CckA